MKKIIILALATVMAFALSACTGGSSQSGDKEPPSSGSTSSSTPESTEKPSSDTSTSTNESDTKVLVAYFSLPETTDANNMTTEEENSVVVIDGEVLGNTQYVAYLIEKITGGDIFRIETKTPYPTDHDELVDLADKEKSEKARPELLTDVENIEQYDVIFLGYPNWWGDMPMALYTFLEENDFSGKTIIPFNTHGGSGFSSTINTIAKLQPDATVETNGFTVSRNDVHESADDVTAWVKELGYAK